MTPSGDISAFIIAGGKSRRFGRDKSLYPLHGIALIEHVIAVLRKTFSDITVIGDECDKFTRFGLPCYPDLIPGLGPIGGIYTALNHSKTDKAFMVATDMPYLSAGLIAYMKSIADGHDLVIPFVNGYYESLHAIYSKQCIGAIKHWIDLGQRQIIGFFGDVDMRKVSEEEIRRYADIDLVFKNINFLEDLAP